MFTAVKHSTNKPYGPVVGFVCALTVAFGLLLGSGSQSVAAQATPNEDENASLKGTVSGLYSLDEAGHAVAGVPIHVELTGNAVFTETATNVWEGETTLEPLSLQWESDGTQPVSYKVYFDSAKEIRSPLSRSEGVVAREAQKVSQSVPVATAAHSYPEHDYATVKTVSHTLLIMPTIMLLLVISILGVALSYSRTKPPVGQNGLHALPVCLQTSTTRKE